MSLYAAGISPTSVTRPAARKIPRRALREGRGTACGGLAGPPGAGMEGASYPPRRGIPVAKACSGPRAAYRGKTTHACRVDPLLLPVPRRRRSRGARNRSVGEALDDLGFLPRLGLTLHGLRGQDEPGRRRLWDALGLLLRHAREAFRDVASREGRPSSHGAMSLHRRAAVARAPPHGGSRGTSRGEGRAGFARPGARRRRDPRPGGSIARGRPADAAGGRRGAIPCPSPPHAASALAGPSPSRGFLQAVGPRSERPSRRCPGIPLPRPSSSGHHGRAENVPGGTTPSRGIAGRARETLFP